MSKNKNKNKNRDRVGQVGTNGNSSGATPSAPKVESKTPSSQELLAVNEVSESAIAEAADVDIDAVSTMTITPEMTNLPALLRKAQEALELCRKREKRANEFKEELDKERVKLSDQEKSQRERSRELDRQEKELKEERTALDAQQREILDQEEALKKRELNAEAGFITERRESLRLLEEEARLVRQEIGDCRKVVAEERLALERDLAHRMEEHEELLRRNEAEMKSRFESEYEELKKNEQKLHLQLVDIERAKRKLEFERQDIEEQRKNLEQRTEQRAAAREEALNFEIKALNARLSSASADRDRLDAILREREESDRRFGNKSPEQVLAELNESVKCCQKLEKQLAARPNLAAVERLALLEREREAWEGEQYRLTQEKLELERKLGLCEIAVTEVETLRDQKKALETSRNLLQAALEELRADVEDRIRRSDGVSPFPALMQMDEDKALRSSVNLQEDAIDLSEFTTDLQHRIASDPDASNPLYYSLRDLRCFLGGLAMSRLHLLQGISGTGKTSLPIAFSRAVGAGFKLIEVQAGWRDRQDLVGHFNAFERRFYESEFLQGLYEAQSPCYDGRPYIVVLDEMNLSHPEQYFADLLSALEQEPHLQKLDLMTAPVEPAPKLMTNGRTLLIPRNVWFVGTANHDETTKDFADKTYDRGHVMELPRNREEFAPQRPHHRNPVAFESLKGAFDQAREKNGKHGTHAYKFLDEKFAEFLGRKFRVGWGNRLERQMMDFVPVVVAAGGSVGEATDHILATKLLRKIRNRHDTRMEHLVELQTLVQESWKELDKKGKPTHSLAIIADELRRLGSGDDE
ncbi:MAG: hypothetical protein FDZ69_04575 [Deltaproteobacteria bacterium]|nr:MAG: hypothetical protein FDZ69_04575 [Deltaproteobacteria bacterium]